LFIIDSLNRELCLTCAHYNLRKIVVLGW